ncbi:MAG: transglycosylase SLT domain-containing protein [Thermodesulfobacteriota bacterium]
MKRLCFLLPKALCLVALAGLLPAADSPVLSSPEDAVPCFEPVPLPRSLSLCGERMPLEDPNVREMLDRELLTSVWDRARAFLWFKRAARYFPHIEKKLAAAGMPDDLKYLSVAESSLIPNIRSSAGALGTWQFMAATGERMGLRYDQYLDERMDFERATEAALLYLRQLKEMFGSWTTAMAAYNCGENRVKSEMKEQRVTDYYRLDLPPETERYVFRIAAIKLILENPRRYGFSISKDQLYPSLPYDSVSVSVRAPIHIADVAETLGTDYKMIRELNPQILGRHLPTGSYVLKVPPGSGPRLSRLLKQHNAPPQPPGERTENTYTVKPGDTLIDISRRTGVPLDALRKFNHLQDSYISPGQKLRLAP